MAERDEAVTYNLKKFDKELLPKLEKDIENVKSELGRTLQEIYELDKEAYELEFQFYRGAGGEIESRLVQKMDDGSVVIGEIEEQIAPI